MYQYHCLNPIAEVGLKNFNGNYAKTDKIEDADAVLGPMGIVVSDAILGEVTPVMAQAVGSCRARKFLVPMNSCGVWVAGTQEMGLAGYVKLVVEEATRYLEEEDA